MENITDDPSFVDNLLMSDTRTRHISITYTPSIINISF